MRLTCPNCGTEYDIPDGMIPAAGRHVQCTTCHTRWFARGGPRAEVRTEEQILTRLEARPRRPVAVAAAAAPEPAAEAAPAPDPVVGPRPAVLPPRTGPAKPAERPAATQPAPLAAEPLPGPRSGASRPSPRLELGAEPATLPVSAARPEPPRSRFGTGLLVALTLSGLALAAYAYRVDIAARIPAAAPALDAYGSAVDGLREDLDAGFDELRSYLDGV